MACAWTPQSHCVCHCRLFFWAALMWAESRILCSSPISCLLGPSTSSSGFYYSNLCLTSIPWNVARTPSSSLSVCGSLCPSALLLFHSGDKCQHFLHCCPKLGIPPASYFLASLLICFHLQDVLHGLWVSSFPSLKKVFQSLTWATGIVPKGVASALTIH